MFELRRQQLLNQNGGTPAAAQNGAPPSAPAAPSPHHAARSQLSPRQAAVAAMQQEDKNMKRFLERLQTNRDDNRPTEALFNPTVPTGLSRRMIHRQGAGFLDPTVAAIGSAAADRFLATVLQQAVSCRAQRLKGVELTRQAARDRKRHKRHYQEAVHDRKRRKLELASEREKLNVAEIRAAEALKQKLATAGKEDADENGSASGSTKTKKKKKATPALVNGKRKREELEDTIAEYDSLDEEEEHYEQYDDGDDDDDDSESLSDEEEEDETMVLWDLARPLEAWDFRFDGKVGMDPHAESDSDDDSDGDDRPAENGGTEEMDVDGTDAAAIEEDGKPAAVARKAPPSQGAEEKKHARKSSTSSPISGPSPNQK